MPRKKKEKTVDYSLSIENLKNALNTRKDKRRINVYTDNGDCVFGVLCFDNVESGIIKSYLANPGENDGPPLFASSEEYKYIKERYSTTGEAIYSGTNSLFFLAHLGGWRTKKGITREILSGINTQDPANRSSMLARQELHDDIINWSYIDKNGELEFSDNRNKDKSEVSHSDKKKSIAELICKRNKEFIDYAIKDREHKKQLADILRKFIDENNVHKGIASENNGGNNQSSRTCNEKLCNSSDGFSTLIKILSRIMDEYEKCLESETEKRNWFLARVLSWLTICAVLGRTYLDTQVLERGLYPYMLDEHKSRFADWNESSDKKFPKTDKTGIAEEHQAANHQKSNREDILPDSTDTPPALTRIPPAVEMIGREKAIQDIQDLLAQNKIIYIHAVGGVGKTALAAHIANAVKDEVMSGNSPYRHIAWIKSTRDLKKDLTGLGIPTVMSAQSEEDKYNAASVFFQTTPTFLVIDNMDEPPTRKEVIILNTISGRTKILITTRAAIPIGKPYNLEPLESESAIVLFYRYFQEGKDLTTDQIKDREDYPFAQSIVDEATNNALFIELIGKMAYKEHWHLDALWEKLEKDIFGQNSKYGISTDHGGDEKLLMQIQKLYEMSRLSDRQKEIMSFIALFPAEHSIFFAVFEWAGFEDDETDNLGELQKRGWIERDDEGYLIHTMVRGSIKQQRGETVFDEDRYEKLIRELCNTEQYMPRDMVYTKVLERIVVPETICSRLAEQGSKKIAASNLFNYIAIVYNTQGNYGEALRLYKQALGICEKVLGTEHSETATTYNNMAVTYRKQGNLDEALRFCKKALAIREKVLGTEHPDTATTYNNIANVYYAQGKYEDALAFYESSLSIREKMLGTEHPDTAITYNNIANIYYDQGKYEDALAFYERALSILRKMLGAEHPDIATTHNNIANVFYVKGEYEVALEYHKKALTIRERTLGTEHPETATTYINIAMTYRKQGDYYEAWRYCEKALAVCEKVLGTEHPVIDRTYFIMEQMYADQGNYKESRKYDEKRMAMHSCLKKLYTEDPTIMQANIPRDPLPIRGTMDAKVGRYSNDMPYGRMPANPYTDPQPINQMGSIYEPPKRETTTKWWNIIRKLWPFSK